jgi:DNA-binding NarL/FixJ family response regulator
LGAIRILVVDDHAIVRHALCALLGAEPGMEVVSEASDGLQAIRKAEEYQPDVVLLDVAIPEINGLHAAPLIKRAAPDAEILMVSQYEDRFFARHAFAAGARGFLTKTHATAELVGAVRQVFAKKRFVSTSTNADADVPGGSSGLV